MSDKKITIYTSPTCSFCQQAKTYLNEKGVKYEEKDVTKDSKFADEAAQKSGQFGVPVIEIDSKVIIGFDQAALDKELA